MKQMNLLITLALFFGLAFLSACSDKKETKQPETEVTSEDVKKEAKEAIETAKTYTQQQKEEYLQQTEAKIENLERKMQELQAKAQSTATELEGETKAEFNQSMEVLRSKKQAAAERLIELRASSGKAWDDIKAGMDSAMDELNQAFDRARSHFEG